jgi:hypothetical protein
MGGLSPWRANLITELRYLPGLTCLKRQVSITLNNPLAWEIDQLHPNHPAKW